MRAVGRKLLLGMVAAMLVGGVALGALLLTRGPAAAKPACPRPDRAIPVCRRWDPTEALTRNPAHAYNVGLVFAATGRYTRFIAQFIAGADRHFLPQHRVTYFVATDQNVTAEVARTRRRVVVLPFDKLGWPFDSMMRFKMLTMYAEAFDGMDFLYPWDVDLAIVAPVGNEILGARVGAQFPGFFTANRGSYEERPASCACVGPREGGTYYAGGVWGGAREDVLDIARAAVVNIELDSQIGVVPTHNDESVLNRAFIDCPPTRVLSPEYCMPDTWTERWPFAALVPRVVALTKDHAEVRA
jgi:histo-blood group ABO system transferase